MREMPQVNYDPDKIEWRCSGKGNSQVLLLHGWGGNLDSLKPLEDALSSHCKVITISFPGFGNSPEPSGMWGTSEYACCISDWLQSKEIEYVNIIGHSFGGRIGIALTASFPSNVDKLVLINSAGLKFPSTLNRALRIRYYKFLKRIQAIAPETFRKMILAKTDRMGSDDWRSATLSMRKILSKVISEDLSEDLSGISSHTLLIWGGDDKDTPVWMGERMSHLIPHSNLVIIPNAGHYSYLDNKGEVLTRIWQHLELPAAW